MPVSRRRKPKQLDPRQPQKVRLSRAGLNPVWLVPAMLLFFGLSLVWLLVYYLTQGGVLGMERFGGWNVLIGFGFAVVGLMLATRWK